MKIEVYTTQYCPYCIAAKDLLRQKGLPFKEIDLTEDAALREQISQKAGGYRTVPMIFIDGKFIGGFTDLQDYLSKQ